MKRPTLKACIVGTWQDAWRAVGQMPDQHVLMLVVLVAIFFVEHDAMRAARASYPDHAVLSALLKSRSFKSFIVDASNFANVLLVVPLTRYVLLGNASSALKVPRKTYIRYFFHWVLYVSVQSFITWSISALHTSPKPLVALTGFITILVLAVVLTHFLLCYLLIFPLVALELPLQWKAVWSDMSGQRWSAFLIFVIAGFLPAFLLAVPIFNAPLFHAAPLPIQVVVKAALKVVEISLGTVATAWIYRRCVSRSDDGSAVLTADGKPVAEAMPERSGRSFWQLDRSTASMRPDKGPQANSDRTLGGYRARNAEWLLPLGLYGVLVLSSNSGGPLPIGVRLITGLVAVLLLGKACYKAARASTPSATVVAGIIMATLAWLFYAHGVQAVYMLPYPFGQSTVHLQRHWF
ncbi:hypothetical protein [Burkholderia sp. Se-20378]|uniref:hypothetical protein n=1 Tax=Burkholderia sp. Se-20378 TaxID=2703899 RepID=UPI00197F4147|nr:hypothetical protein [Burkholderia sp. Se-20378]MBN3774428.1 hypothetical protein [Burkholderia sp. Se-20378]